MSTASLWTSVVPGHDGARDRLLLRIGPALAVCDSEACSKLCRQRCAATSGTSGLRTRRNLTSRGGETNLLDSISVWTRGEGSFHLASKLVLLVAIAGREGGGYSGRYGARGLVPRRHRGDRFLCASSRRLPARRQTRLHERRLSSSLRCRTRAF